MSKDKLREILYLGGEVAGASAGGAIGLIGGLEGALLGGGLGVIISKGIIEVCERFLSRREIIRSSAAAAFAIVEINRKIQNGETLREDGFFENSNSRSKAEELFEGVLLKCKNEYQEKKVKYIANIFAKVVFDKNLSSNDANKFLILAERLSFRQLCILSLIKKKDSSMFTLKSGDLRGNAEYRSNPKMISQELEWLLSDFLDLHNAGLIERIDDTALLDISDVDPNGMDLSRLGEKLYGLMGLHEIESEDLLELVEVLK